jgi:hypothetical protein
MTETEIRLRDAATQLQLALQHSGDDAILGMP